MANGEQRFNSRQSMQNEKFEIFHYKDKKPENVSIHHHEFFEVYFFVGGKVDFLVEGKNYALQHGDILLINPQELHQAKVVHDLMYERYVLWINKSYLLSFENLNSCFLYDSPTHINLVRPDIVTRALLQEILEKLNQEFYSDNLGSNLYAQGLLMQFLVLINRLASTSTPIKTKVSEESTVTRVLHYIGAHFTEKLTVEDIADHFFVSKYYLSHEFSKEVGTSIYRYILFRRLMFAKEMMENGVSPIDVYQSCGFSDYSNFYRAFKTEYGISPKEYMKK